ncbi:hypothetical protein Ahy_A03g013156 [Arachis hypogaea]|uniref:Uncharacterized protein n=1 Tax=Arachis hypogaea TaxID=3818 RepID=A0A445DV19_ARAHY|nr:hypothetical protein Ahy_A03g013156 [Arachis hypogaea]
MIVLERGSFDFKLQSNYTLCLTGLREYLNRMLILCEMYISLSASIGIILEIISHALPRRNKPMNLKTEGYSYVSPNVCFHVYSNLENNRAHLVNTRGPCWLSLLLDRRKEIENHSTMQPMVTIHKRPEVLNGSASIVDQLKYKLENSKFWDQLLRHTLSLGQKCIV